LYSPLKELSKIRFDNKGECHKIRELFRAEAHFYDAIMWQLAWIDNFTIYDKREISYENKNHVTKYPQIKISKPLEGIIIPLFDDWINLKYFEKK